MLEKDKFCFYDIKNLTETKNIRERANKRYLTDALNAEFSKEKFVVRSVEINETGKHKNIRELPPYVEVVIENQTGKRTEEIIVWVPLAWNDRFIGTGGGGTGTGGRIYITSPKATDRSMNLPTSVCNGFAAATADARNVKRLDDRMISKKNGAVDWDYYENWRARTTHDMARFGKAVTVALHERPIRYSYMHGGSGGGRQSMAEAQIFPDDFDGIWATCPAINWTEFLVGGLWLLGCMNTYHNLLPYEKLEAFMKGVHDSVGGAEAFHDLACRVDFDPHTMVGKKTAKGIITEQDAVVMEHMWSGTMPDGSPSGFMMYYPGDKFWNHYVPVGAFSYNPITKKPILFILVTMYCRWVVGDPKARFENVTMEEAVSILQKSRQKFPTGGIDDPDLRPFANLGHKLILDHGYADPLIPIEGTLEYYRRVCSIFGGKDKVDGFFRMFLNPGDGHGNCEYFGPGIPEYAGMTALIDWVEKGIAPKEIHTVRVDKKGKLLEESSQSFY